MSRLCPPSFLGPCDRWRAPVLVVIAGSTTCIPASRQENCRSQVCGALRRAEAGKRRRGYWRLGDQLWPLPTIVMPVLLAGCPAD